MTVSTDTQAELLLTEIPSETGTSAAVSGPARLRFHVTRRVFRNPSFLVGFVLLTAFVLMAVLAPVLATHDPNALNTDARLEGPGTQAWLGTDALGRDLYSRLLHGASVTLRAAVLAVGVASLIGIPLGLAAGYMRGWLDTALSTLNDTMMSMPALLFSVAIITALGPGLTNAMIAIGLILAPLFFRISRAAASSVRHATYIEAARSLGCSGPRVLVRHVLPNTAGPLLVVTTFGFSISIVAEATLSFLGLGVRPPDASWGSLTREAFAQIRLSSWGIVPPVVAIILVVISIALIGDALQDAIGRQVDRSDER